MITLKCVVRMSGRILFGSIFKRSRIEPQKTKKKENPKELPPPIDAFLMMYQTETVRTDTAKCEIDARFCASGQASLNRVPTLRKTKNGLKPRFQAIFPWQGHKDSDPGHAVLERL